MQGTQGRHDILQKCCELGNNHILNCVEVGKDQDLYWTSILSNELSLSTFLQSFSISSTASSISSSSISLSFLRSSCKNLSAPVWFFCSISAMTLSSSCFSRCPSLFLTASFPAPISSTSLAFSASSRLVGRAMIGTSYLTLSMTDLHPQWHMNPPTLEWLRIRLCRSHPSTIIALSPISSRNSSVDDR